MMLRWEGGMGRKVGDYDVKVGEIGRKMGGTMMLR